MGSRLRHMGSSTAYTQKPPVQRGEPLARNMHVELAWAGLVASLLAGLYSTANGATLWIAAILLAALLFLPTKRIRMHAVDWSVLLLGGWPRRNPRPGLGHALRVKIPLVQFTAK